MLYGVIKQQVDKILPFFDPLRKQFLTLLYVTGRCLFIIVCMKSKKESIVEKTQNKIIAKNQIYFIIELPLKNQSTFLKIMSVKVKALEKLIGWI